MRKIDIDDPEIADLITADQKSQLEEEIELQDGAGAEFDQELVSKGELSPVFFGSALTNFGVETFLRAFPCNDNFTASEKIRCRSSLIRWRKKISQHLYLKFRQI